PAGLGEDLPAQFLRSGQSVVGGGLLRRSVSRRQHAQEQHARENGRANRGAALHLESSRHLFFATLRPRTAKRKGWTQNRAAGRAWVPGGASGTMRGWATGATGRRNGMSMQPFRKDGPRPSSKPAAFH